MHLFMSLDRSVESQPRQAAAQVAAAARAAIGLCAALGAGPAHPQAGLSAAITSEYSVRGVSLSRGRPAPQLRVDYDALGGWYAGALLSRAVLPDDEPGAQLLAYGGYAQRLQSGLTWEVGALNSSFTQGKEYRYHEFYAGVARDRLGGRLYFSPSYYGGAKTAYAEVNTSYPLRDRLTLLGHIGLLHALGGGAGEKRNWLDLRLALGLDLGDWNVQLALLGRTPGAGALAPRAVAVSASYAF
jgi:uncharacterized protein (TIGR02001 family)